MNAATNANADVFSAMGSSLGVDVAGWENVSLVPSAFTIQVMYPEPVGTAGGMVRIGRLKTLPNLTGNTRTWDAFAEQFTSYSAPRLCSGGKLALRGVQVSAVPYDMNALSDFTPLDTLSDSSFTWSGSGSLLGTLHADGFAPIVIVQDGTSGDLRVLVTCEWRVRFDPSNPAMAAHVSYKPGSQSLWTQAISDAEAAGNGVLDIAEAVAEAGEMAGRAAGI
jgi:hypothetical protein